MPTPTEVQNNRLRFRREFPLVFEYLSHPEQDSQEFSVARARNSFNSQGRVSDLVARRIEEDARHYGWSRSESPASAMDATHIPNGIYSVATENESVHYKIYTVQSGQWEGRRVIKFFSVNNPPRDGQYAAFAFLNCDGSTTLWSRFENRDNEAFIRFLPVLRIALTDTNIAATEYFMTRYTFTRRFQCVICNRFLEGGETALCDSHIVEEAPTPSPFTVVDPLEIAQANLRRCEVTGQHIQ